MVSRVLNLLWLNLEFPPPPDPEDGSVHPAMPVPYMRKAREAAARHPRDAVDLWIDSKRLTEKQLAYLTEALEDGRPNLRVKDLRSLPEYDREELFNKGDDNPRWRDPNQTSLIWRQVDAAKVLVSLQAQAGQVFFADLDFAHINMDDPAIQSRLGSHGLAVSGQLNPGNAYACIENQAWGFDAAACRPFFAERYMEALQDAYRGRNGWLSFQEGVKQYAKEKDIPYGDLLMLGLQSDGSQAMHPPGRAVAPKAGSYTP